MTSRRNSATIYFGYDQANKKCWISLVLDSKNPEDVDYFGSYIKISVDHGDVTVKRLGNQVLLIPNKIGFHSILTRIVNLSSYTWRLAPNFKNNTEIAQTFEFAKKYLDLNKLNKTLADALAHQDLNPPPSFLWRNKYFIGACLGAIGAIFFLWLLIPTILCCFAIAWERCCRPQIKVNLTSYEEGEDITTHSNLDKFITGTPLALTPLTASPRERADSSPDGFVPVSSAYTLPRRIPVLSPQSISKPSSVWGPPPPSLVASPDQSPRSGSSDTARTSLSVMHFHSAGRPTRSSAAYLHSSRTVSDHHQANKIK